MPLVDGPLPVTVAVVASRATAMGEAMDLWVANTDRRWFDFLRQAGLEEVNFWSPSPSPPSSAIAVGTPWIFRLKKPDYALAGFGYFARFEQLSARLAWDRFGQGNGFASFEEFLDQVVRLRRLLRTSYPDRDTKIGCTTLVGACFLEEDRWLAPVPGFEPNVVRGKGYYVNSSEGDAISEWLAQQQAAAALPESVAALPVAGYREALTRVRLGQYGFQALVRSAYGALRHHRRIDRYRAGGRPHRSLRARAAPRRAEWVVAPSRLPPTLRRRAHRGGSQRMDGSR